MAITCRHSDNKQSLKKQLAEEWHYETPTAEKRVELLSSIQPTHVKIQNGFRTVKVLKRC